MIRPVTEKDIPACGYLQIPLPKITEEREKNMASSLMHYAITDKILQLFPMRIRN